VSRQYSARSCPRSSECKALRKPLIAITKPKISVVRGKEHDHNLFRYEPIKGAASRYSEGVVKYRAEQPIKESGR
jgi:hypothetical protein